MLPSRWAFLVLSAVGRILVPLEQRRRRLPGRWPQIIAIVMLVVFILVRDAWRNWLQHERPRREGRIRPERAAARSVSPATGVPALVLARGLSRDCIPGVLDPAPPLALGAPWPDAPDEREPPRLDGHHGLPRFD